MSDVPNVEVANSLSQGGVRSTNASPTATTGSDEGPVSAATISAAPSGEQPGGEPGERAVPPAEGPGLRRRGGGGSTHATSILLRGPDRSYEVVTPTRNSRTTGTSARSARPRWLMASFSASVSSDVVRVPPSGTNTGS